MAEKGWDTSDPTDPAALPEWAVEKARASLRLGISLPDVEKRLIAGGLSPATAEAVVNRVLGGHVRATTPPPAQESTQTFEMLLAGGLSVLCILFGYLHNGAFSACFAALWVVGPFYRIWLGRDWTRVAGWLVLVVHFIYRFIRLVA